MTAMKRVVIEIQSYHLFLRILIALVGAGFCAAIGRFVFGLGATTNLNDTYAWGLWHSFDVVTSCPLA